MPSSLQSEMVGSTLLMVQNSHPVDSQEFTQFLGMIRSQAPTGVVIWAPLHGPNSAQRKSGREALDSLGARTPTVAVVTPSSTARGIVALVNAFGSNQQLKAFSPQQLDSALSFARVDPAEREGVVAVLE